MMVRVIFTRNHKIGSIILRGFLWSAWSHCAIIDGDEVIEAAAPGGVRVRPLADLIADSTKWEIIEIPCKNPAAVIAAARKQVGAPYDWLGVVGIGFRRRWQDDDAWFCSESIASAFYDAGEPIVRLDAYRITPRDIHLPIRTCPECGK